MTDTARIPPAVDQPAKRFERIAQRRARIGLVAGGLGTYWPQFSDLLPTLHNSVRRVIDRFEGFDCDVVDAGFVSDPQDSATAAEKLRLADCDLVVVFLTTYLTSSMVLPIAQRTNTPVLLIDLQPTMAMDHANTDTGRWLAYCGQCPLPEVANVFRRSGIAFRSVSGYLDYERAWRRIGRLAPGRRRRAAALRSAATRRDGTPLPGHARRLDRRDAAVQPAAARTWRSSNSTTCGPGARRHRGAARSNASSWSSSSCASTIRSATTTAWASRVVVGLDRLVDDFALDALAYYHRGLTARSTNGWAPEWFSAPPC